MKKSDKKKSDIWKTFMQVFEAQWTFSILHASIAK